MSDDEIEIEYNEDFYWLGKQHTTHFFLHKISSPNWTVEISLQIYNCLIHNKFITSPDENIVIYTINQNRICCIGISHTTSEINFKVSSKNLEEFFPTLVNTDRKDLIGIRYYYDNPRYSYYELENVNKFWQSIFSNIPKNIKIEEIIYGATSKPF